jgi:branched-chain amino acid transport system substrate-binding protein
VASDSIIFFAEIQSKEFYSNWIITINASITASLAILLAYRQKFHGLHGKTHVALAVGLVLWLFADIIWATYHLVLDIVPPIPSAADYLWLTAYGFLGYYLYMTYKEFHTKFNFGRKALIASVIGNAIFLGYIVTLTASLSVLSTPRGLAMFVVIVTYPILDAILMIPAIVILVEFRKEPVWFTPWICESLGIFLIGLSDSWFAVIVLTSLVEQLWLSALFFAAHFLVMAAGLVWYLKYLIPRTATTDTATSTTTVSNTLDNPKKMITPSDYGQSSPKTKTTAATGKKNLAIVVGFAVLAGLFIIGIVVYPSSPLSALFGNPNSELILPSTAPPNGGHTTMLGALIPLTGAASSLGESEEVALKIAVEDVNQYYSHGNSKTRVGLIVEDTQSNPTVTLERLKDLAPKGVRIVIGPSTSADLQTAKNFADQKGILLVSPSSTAPSLAIPGDNIFRLVPDDTNQGQAIARHMWQDSVRVVIPIWRTDVYGNDLVKATTYNFRHLGGTVLDGIGYEPRTGDFSTSLNRINFMIWDQDLKSLSFKASQAIAKYGADKVGVYLVAFDEVVPILFEAQSQPILSTLKWYGSDGSALNDKLIKNNDASMFAIKTGFLNPIFGIDYDNNNNRDSEHKFRLVDNEIHQRIGKLPRTYAEVAYDAFWVSALTENAIGASNNIDSIKNIFLRTAASYAGITGNTSLNQAGDRRYGDYDFWAIRTTGEDQGGYTWQQVGRFEVNPSTNGKGFNP